MDKTKLLLEFTTALNEQVVKAFENKEMYDQKYIVNSKITAGSTYERMPVIDQFTVLNAEEIPLTDLILGQNTSMNISATGKLAVCGSKPKTGKELNAVDQKFYSLNMYVELAYDKDKEQINILSLDIR
ncbi:hypothetical protein [Fluviicola sp.]|uniref:hypothetical protein n=1 Tax=Fluviicola sp. TaxID=1917219 RepID=UPI0031DAA4C6